MKKVFLFLMVMITIPLNAQKIISMNRDFNLSGTCVLFSKTSTPKAQDRCDFVWELSNTVIGDNNNLRFYLKDDNGDIVESKKWNGGITIFMLKSEDNSKSYFVEDNEFSHLRIFEIEAEGYDEHVYGISLYSILLEDYR